MQSSERYHFIIDEPSETDLTHHFNVKKLISFTFGRYGNNVANFKMLQIVLHLLARHLNMLEQVVDIKEAERSKALEELRERREEAGETDSDASSTDSHIPLVKVKSDKSKTKKKEGKLKKKELSHSSKVSTLDELDGDRSPKGKKHVKPKKGKEADEKSIIDESEHIEKKKGKKTEDRPDAKLKKHEQVDDAPVSGEPEKPDEKKGTDAKLKQHEQVDNAPVSEPEKPGDKKGKAKSSGKSKKEEVTEDKLTSDESDDGKKRKKLKSRSKISIKAKKQRSTTDKPTSDKSKHDVKEHATSKRDEVATTPKESKKEEEKVRRADETTVSTDSKDDKKKVKKVADKVAVRSKRSRHTVESASSDESEDEQKGGKKSKYEKGIKSKKDHKADTSVMDKSDDEESKTSKKRKDKIELKSKKSKSGSIIISKSKKAGEGVKSDDISTTEESEDRKKEDVISRGSESSEEESSESEEDIKVMDRKSTHKTEVRSKKTEMPIAKGPAVSKSELKFKTKKERRDVMPADSRSRQDSIELATLSQFKILESNVKRLMQNTGPMPEPMMPDNKKLRDDLASGSATLVGTMEAMKVNARVKAAEKGLSRMADLLTQLAEAGVFPPQTADLIDQLHDEHGELSRLVSEANKVADLAVTSEMDIEKIMSLKGLPVAVKSELLAIAALPKPVEKTKGKEPVRLSPLDATALAAQAKSDILAQALSEEVFVTRSDMCDAMKRLKDEILKNMNALTSKATASAEKANSMARAVAETLDAVLTVDQRIDTLNSLTSDYAEQLSGFDSGLTTQLASLEEQIVQMQQELKEGLAVFDSSDKIETTGVIDLRRGLDTMTSDVNRAIRTHAKFVIKQDKVADELKKLIECVEMLREQKADRDEVRDGLRDKVDVSRLLGIPNEDAFESTRNELNKRIDMCYDKFKKQDEVWETAIKDLTKIAVNKAEVEELEDLEDYTKSNLKEMQQQLHKLQIMLGEPKTALMIRRIQHEGYDASMPPAMVVESSSKNDGQTAPSPSPAPSLPDQPDDEGPCTIELRIPVSTDGREHICKRWVGGSHTMTTEYTIREEVSTSHIQKTPATHYTGLGVDGHPYMLEEELQPCLECNEMLLRIYDPLPAVPPLIEVGGGDQMPVDETEDKKK